MLVIVYKYMVALRVYSSFFRTGFRLKKVLKSLKYDCDRS